MLDTPMTKNVNAISLIKIEKEKGVEGCKVVEENVMELNELDALEPIESLNKEEEMEEGTDGRSVKGKKEELTGVKMEVEVLVETPRSRHIGYYLKHKINKKLIEGLIDNHKYNESFLDIRLGKMDHETYKSLPAKSMYNAILKKKLVKKDDMERNFVIPCNIGGIKNTFLDNNQGRDIRFEKGMITLNSGKNKIYFVKVPALPSELEKNVEDDLDPITPTNTISKLILEWEERIKYHQEKEMEFNQWRSMVFDNKGSIYENGGCKVSDEGGVTLFPDHGIRTAKEGWWHPRTSSVEQSRG
ncbi:hypothetical protein Tco_1401141 [Tanacetum coccineum]